MYFNLLIYIHLYKKRSRIYRLLMYAIEIIKVIKNEQNLQSKQRAISTINILKRQFRSCLLFII